MRKLNESVVNSCLAIFLYMPSGHKTTSTNLALKRSTHLCEVMHEVSATLNDIVADNVCGVREEVEVSHGLRVTVRTHHILNVLWG